MAFVFCIIPVRNAFLIYKPKIRVQDITSNLRTVSRVSLRTLSINISHKTFSYVHDLSPS